jgi:hypothetical protein
MNRITKKQLQARIDTINIILGTPENPYTRTESGLSANVGNFHLSEAYGGYGVGLMTDGGGSSDPIWRGHISARDAYDRISAFIAGIQFSK